MDDLLLVKPNLSYANQIAAYRQEFLDRTGSLDGTGNLRNYPDPVDWLYHVENMTRLETCPPGLVPATNLLCIRRSDNKLVGMVDIRHELNDHLFNFGGNIGYSVRPDERRKGYAKAMLGMALKESAALGLDKVLVTCNRSNEASRRVILARGGVLENELWDEDDGEFTQRYWIDLT